jgi:hypothetical protein
MYGKHARDELEALDVAKECHTLFRVGVEGKVEDWKFGRVEGLVRVVWLVWVDWSPAWLR